MQWTVGGLGTLRRKCANVVARCRHLRRDQDPGTFGGRELRGGGDRGDIGGDVAGDGWALKQRNPHASVSAG